MAFRFADPWLARFAAVGIAAIVVIGIVLFANGPLQGIEERGSDLVWRIDPLKSDERRLIIVDIDESSLAAHGAWPWPRSTLAELSRRIAQLGARLQVYDIVFPEAKSGDEELRAALASTPTVLAQIFSLDPKVEAATGQLGGALASPPCAPPIPAAFGYIANADDLSNSVTTVGHISPRISPDGAVRQLPALICFKGSTYAALGLATLTAAADLPPRWELAAPDGWLKSPWVLRNAGLPGIEVPLNEHGDVRVSYRLPRSSFISVSAADVLAGKAPRDLFDGAWVLIGATAFGVGDSVPTPLGGLVAGVEVHAQFISALLDNRLPATPRAAPWLLAIYSLAGVATLLLFTLRRGRLTVYGLPIAGLLLAVLAFALHALFVLRANLWIGWIDAALFCFLASVLLAVVEHARMRFERERVFENLSSYLPAPVAREVALIAPSGRIDARRCEITVLVADLRNFSAYCELRPPEEAAALLHAFFSRAVRIVERHGGLVEGFQGDAIIAIWNAPTPSRQQVQQAFAAAHEMLQDVPALFPDPPPPGLELLALGVGIETGAALVGSVGPAMRRHHTALGDTVTVAVRLQSMTADLAQPLLVGPGAAAQLPKEALVSLGEFLLEGLKRTYTVFALPPRGDAA